MADLLKDMPAIRREQQNIRNTNPNVATDSAANNPAAHLQQFEASWDKLLTSFGSAGMKDAVALLDKLTEGLNSLGDWAHKNPDLARVAVDVAGGLGAVAVALGTLSTAIFFFGPALKMLGIGGGGAAGGAAAAGGGLGLLGIGAVAGGAVAATANAVGALANQRYGDMPLAGGPSAWPTWQGGGSADDGQAKVRLNAYHPDSDRPIVIMMDGVRVAKIISKHQADSLRLPSSGSGDFDPRNGVMTPATLLRA